MLIHGLILAVSFLIILAGSELFTNGVEWAGHRLNVAEAAVGSLLAAVGTAMPETFVPAVALLSGRDDPVAHQAIGIGAIVGAPLMLSTLALFVMGIAGVAFRARRDSTTLRVQRSDVRRDLLFFLPVFLAIVVIGLLETSGEFRRWIAFALLAVYALYSAMMLRLDRAANLEVEHGLYAARVLPTNPTDPSIIAIMLQVLAGVGAILFGSMEFVDQIVLFSRHAGVNPGVLSLVLSPLATELPEKYNSVVWIRQRKDNLALANITGAMVFQSCIPVALGLAFTSWHLSPAELLAGIIGLVSATILYFNVRDNELGTPTLVVGGVAYVAFLTGLTILGVL